jgi:4-hydroxyphenylacetate 3-monooxygenase/4-hydroxybutyryl-CoA dehydratase/vinylacetyl-CoA-Delta-isomerase
MKRNIHINGNLIGRDDPLLEAGINVVSTTFDAAADPDLKHLVTTKSHLNGEMIHRYTHVYQSADDLLKKLEMTRTLCRRVGGCVQRCMCVDTLNAIGVTSREIDQKYGTEYHHNFIKYLKYYQENDLVGNAAQTDPKGDRSQRPSRQADPDLYLRIVEKRNDGIVVRGAKCHNSIAPYADELLVVPTRVMMDEESDWAVSFAIPADADGIKQICSARFPKPRKHLSSPYSTYGIADSVTVFENVFVPWERVFMCGEREYAGRMALLFANFHRHSYCGCKPALTDVFMGATALVAEYNGVAKAHHIQDDIAELIALAETVYACGIAAALTSTKTASGIYEPNSLYSNCGRYLAGKNIYHEYDVLAAAAGGFPATIPPEEDWFNEETKHYLHKYIMRNPKVTAEDQHRLFRFISDFTCSAATGAWQYAGLHGGGSPIMERIGLRSQYDMESKKDLVKYLAGIKK